MEETGKEYLEKLVGNLEQCRQDGTTLPFRVEKLLEHGLLVKVAGLYALVPFNRMPWNYFKYAGAWSAVFPSIAGKRFFCKIERIERDPLKIILDTSAHRFRKFPLTEGMTYNCLVVHVTEYGYFADMGFHFDWEYGSCVGLLHRSVIRRYNMDEACLAFGKTVALQYFGQTSKGPLLGDEARADFLGQIKEGLVAPVLVRKDANGKMHFYIEGKFKARLPVTKATYPGANKKAVHSAIDNLQDNAVIFCKVVAVNNITFEVVLAWVASRIAGWDGQLEGIKAKVKRQK